MIKKGLHKDDVLLALKDELRWGKESLPDEQPENKQWCEGFIKGVEQCIYLIEQMIESEI